MQQIQSVQPSTKSQIIARAEQSRAAMRQPTSMKDASRLGKQLLGCFPHARPADPESYALAITSVLQQYPLGVAEECCDPRTGLARTREFPPTVASIVDWCELRVKRHTGAMIHASKVVLEKEFSDDHRKTMLQRLMGLWKSLKAVPQ